MTRGLIRPMTHERFAEILREYQYTEHQISAIWNARLCDEINESALRNTARYFQLRTRELRRTWTIADRN